MFVSSVNLPYSVSVLSFFVMSNFFENMNKSVEASVIFMIQITNFEYTLKRL